MRFDFWEYRSRNMKSECEDKLDAAIRAANDWK